MSDIQNEFWYIVPRTLNDIKTEKMNLKDISYLQFVTSPPKTREPATFARKRWLEICSQYLQPFVGGMVYCNKNKKMRQRKYTRILHASQKARVSSNQIVHKKSNTFLFPSHSVISFCYECYITSNTTEIEAFDWLLKNSTSRWFFWLTLAAKWQNGLSNGHGKSNS